jgi:hypothetical protein
MCNGAIMHDSRSPHTQLSESALRTHPLSKEGELGVRKWNWKKYFMAEPSSNRPSAQCARGDELDMTLNRGEAR